MHSTNYNLTIILPKKQLRLALIILKKSSFLWLIAQLATDMVVVFYFHIILLVL